MTSVTLTESRLPSVTAALDEVADPDPELADPEEAADDDEADPALVAEDEDEEDFVDSSPQAARLKVRAPAAAKAVNVRALSECAGREVGRWASVMGTNNFRQSRGRARGGDGIRAAAEPRRHGRRPP